MSGPREDEEPVSIEADVPEADWIEQHQPVSDEDDDVSIASDTPEADWIEQHQAIVEAPDADFLPPDDLPEVEGTGEVEQDWIATEATDEEVAAANGPEIPTPPESAGGRGCNVVAAVARAVLRRPLG